MTDGGFSKIRHRHLVLRCRYPTFANSWRPGAGSGSSRRRTSSGERPSACAMLSQLWPSQAMHCARTSSSSGHGECDVRRRGWRVVMSGTVGSCRDQRSDDRCQMSATRGRPRPSSDLCHLSSIAARGPSNARSRHLHAPAERLAACAAAPRPRLAYPPRGTSRWHRLRRGSGRAVCGSGSYPRS